MIGFGSLFGNSAQSFSRVTEKQNANHEAVNTMRNEAADRQMAYQTTSAEKAMQFSSEEAEKNRQWQERMSSTAYQRAVSDLEKAGINPVLAASSGFGGASTPSGSSAQGIAQSGAKADYESVSLSDIYVRELEAGAAVANAATNAAQAVSSELRGWLGLGDSKSFKVGF